MRYRLSLIATNIFYATIRRLLENSARCFHDNAAGGANEWPGLSESGLLSAELPRCPLTRGRFIWPAPNGKQRHHARDDEPGDAGVLARLED